MWTEQQREVIYTRDCNLLVSAAAGSGKTAVLVERIIELITDDANPVGIDELVVVTFAKAAAAEMKERVRIALENKLEQEPDNARLAAQITLVDDAMITTIDSFCLKLVREHFLELDIDPSFRTADTGEVELLEKDALASIMEKHYQEGDAAFAQFVDCFSPGKSDKNVEGLISGLYRYSLSYPWPKIWLDSLKDAYNLESEEDFIKSDKTQYYLEYFKNKFRDYWKKYQMCIEICQLPDGPAAYADRLQEELALISQLIETDDVQEFLRLIKHIEFASLPAAKNVDDVLKNTVAKNRNSYKEFVKSVREKFPAVNFQQMYREVFATKGLLMTMVDLAKEMYELVSAKKRDKNIIDFNDMERLALDLLVKNHNGTITYTDTADILSAGFKEVMVDEYQDSSYLQEYILGAISGNRHNMFMVGDVKQSIYGFRQAVPELFMDKYRRFEQDESQGKKIELQMNFRSRSSVLESANSVFYNVMSQEVGGIEYDDKVRLNSGFDYPLPPDGKEAGGKTQVCIVDIGECDDTWGKEEYEAAYTADRILKILAPDSDYVVFDKSLKEYRKAEPRDIVILMRNDSGWFQAFLNVLMGAGIPTSVQSGEGYFTTRECATVLSVLRVIDNPYQDIELAAVLTSYFGLITYGELATLRKDNKNCYLYENLAECDNPKVQEFLRQLDRWRNMVQDYSLYDVLWDIVFDSGYAAYIATMPAGNKRRENLYALCEKAKNYEKSGSKGVFNFLRYIANIEKYKVEYGEAAQTATENSVRIMTMHKSKGLEFPIVFICGITKPFNMQDVRQQVIIDKDLGIGMYSFDLDKRIKATTLYREALAKKLSLNSLAEEIRILYVALTRAREKLIIVGNSKNARKMLDGYGNMAYMLEAFNQGYSFTDIEECNKPADLLLPTALNNSVLFDVGTIAGADVEYLLKLEDEAFDVDRVVKDKKSVPEYPYEKYTSIRSKMSVSEIKKMSYNADEEDYAKPIQLLDIPEFVSVDGAMRGTAYHRVMECLDYSVVLSEDAIRKQMDRLVELDKLSRQEADMVNVADIAAFVESDLGQRIKAAFEAGSLRREQPFVTGLPPEDIPCYSDLAGSGRIVLVQGVIDLFFVEGDKVVVVDYKTDRVAKDKARDELTKRYKAQLDIYGDALKRLLGGQITQVEKIIYSFSAGEYFQL